MKRTAKKCWALLVLLASPIAAEKPASHPAAAPADAVYDVVEVLSGTWKLIERLTPGGKRHGPLAGVMTISLQIRPRKLLGVRGSGFLHAEESGVLDREFHYCCPPEPRSSNFFIESDGIWVISLETENEKEAILLITSDNTIKGTSGLYEDGLRASRQARYRLVRGHQSRPGLPHVSTLTLLNSTGSQDSSGDSSPANGESACCSVGNLFAKGSELTMQWTDEEDDISMTVKWPNGGGDVWRKGPTGCRGYPVCDGALGKGIKRYGPSAP